MKRFVLGVALGAMVLAPATALAEDVTAPELARRARQSLESGDSSSLTEVTSVDGNTMDPGAALGATEGEARRQRLETLATLADRLPELTTLIPADANQELAAILAQPRFQAPAESMWDRLWDRFLRWLLATIGRFVEAVGGPTRAGLLALAVVGIVAAVIGVRVAGRRASLLEREMTLDRLLAEGRDPNEVEARAEAAAATGDFTTAVRLRFLAGILRLDQRGRIRFTKGLTTADIADHLGSPVFDRLKDRFDLVAYGGRTAGELDHTASVEDWKLLLSEVPV